MKWTTTTQLLNIGTILANYNMMIPLESRNISEHVALVENEIKKQMVVHYKKQITELQPNRKVDDLQQEQATSTITTITKKISLITPIAANINVTSYQVPILPTNVHHDSFGMYRTIHLLT